MRDENDQLSWLKNSEWFDADWYSQQNPDVAEAGLDAAYHFLRYGAAEGRQPGPRFDVEWYLQQNPDVAATGMTAAFHYLHYGQAEGRQPGPTIENEQPPIVDERLSSLQNSDWFNAEWYLQQNPDVAATGMDAALHYLLYGEAEGRQPGPTSEVEQPSLEDERLALLKSSQWFDAEWYLRQNPDVAAESVDAALHYLNNGAAEGRQPSSKFDEGYYLSQLTEPLNQPSALLHYLVHGQNMGLKPVRVWTDAPWWWQLDQPVMPQFDWHGLRDQLNQQPLPVVVIPVFNAAEALSVCLSSLHQHRGGISRVIVIDDASTDSAVTALLDECQQDPFFDCQRNAQNLGFSGTVNRGIALAGNADVILLNSDTEVTSGFAQRLRIAAYSAANIATVTPVSNNAGAFSVPFAGENLVPEQFGLSCFARALAQATVCQPLSVPTGHGFCMYIRRAAIEEVGLFDAEAFPRGYGEENDFCMRSRKYGWQHWMDPRTYIYHLGSASFNEQKQALLNAGRAVIDQRYPDYSHLIHHTFGKTGNVQQLRQKVATLANIPEHKALQVRPRVLYVISTRTGGTPQTNQDLMLALESLVECFILHCDSSQLILQHFAEGVYTDVAQHTLKEPIQALPHMSDEYDEVLAKWLIQWSVELVHVRHIAWHSLGLMQVVKTLGIPLVKSFHDFYTLCPTVKLLDNNLQYCAAQCTPGQGTCSHELWPAEAFSELKHNQIHQWQQLFAQTLELCDVFVTTNQSTKDLLLLRYPALSAKPFKVIPHGRDFTDLHSLAEMPRRDEKIRILCPGIISPAKGLYLIQQLAFSRNDIEIHILGRISEDLTLPENVILHGDYLREQFAERVAQIKPHCGAVLSVWPETWCHTLTEMWAAGVPVMGVDIGAVGERISETRAGWLLRENTVQGLWEVLERMRDPIEWHQKQEAVHNWQLNQGREETCNSMGEKYAELYEAYLSLDRCTMRNLS